MKGRRSSTHDCTGNQEMMARSVVFSEVDEKYTTQTCSHCLKISGNSPKGRTGLWIREWTCVECGTTHDRDVNAEKTFSRWGISVSQEESPVFRQGEMSTSDEIISDSMTDVSLIFVYYVSSTL